MVEVKLGRRTVDLPYTIRIKDVTEEMFDDLVDEDTKAELLDGVMIVHSPTSIRHDDVSGFLRSLMRLFTEKKKQGKVLGPDSLIHLATCCKFAPDMYFLRKHRVPRRFSKKQFEGAPNHISEVLSPSNRGDDLDDKRPAYREARVEEIWFIDPDGGEVIVDRRGKKGYTSHTVTKGELHSTVMPGFWIDVAWLWAEPLPDILDCLDEILNG